MSFAPRAVTVLAAVMLSSIPAFAQANRTWTGLGSNLWNTAISGNWDNGGPTNWVNNDNAIFPTTGANQAISISEFLIAANSTQFTGGTYSINGNGFGLTLVNARTVSVSSGVSASFTGAGGVTTTGGNLLKTGGGNLFLNMTAGNFLTSSTNVIEIQNGFIQTAGSAAGSFNSTTSLILGNGTNSGVLVLGTSGSADAKTFTGLTTSGTGTNNTVINASSVTFSTITLAITGGLTDTYNGTFGVGNGDAFKLNVAFSQTGAGVATVVLNGASAYAGTTAVNANVRLVLGNALALGSNTGGLVTVANGATLDLNGQSVGAKAVTVTGAGATGGGGVLVNTSGTAASLAGTVTLAGGSGNAVGGSGNLTLSGQVTSSGRLDKVGGGVLTLSNGTNNYGGGTRVTNGSVRLGANNAVSAQGLTLSGGALSSGAVDGFNGSFGPLTVSSSSSINLGAGTHTLTFTTLTYTAGTLTVNGWTGLIYGPSAGGQLVFTNLDPGDPNVNYATFLGNVQFTGADLTGNPFPAGGLFIANGPNFELVPVPEPGTVLAVAVGGLGLVGAARRRLARRRAGVVA